MLRQRGNESRGHKWRRTRKPKIAVLTAGKGVGTAIFLLCHHACSIVSARFVPRIAHGITGSHSFGIEPTTVIPKVGSCRY